MQVTLRPGDRMPASIEDVAKKANVSISTVSRVINRRELVNEKTRERVEKVIRELRYRPNAFARGLMLRKSGIVGLVLLGTPRSDHAEHAHEASLWMLGPMAVLAAVCIGLGLAPQVACRLIASVVQEVGGPSAVSTDYDLLTQGVPITSIGWANAGLWIAVLFVLALLSVCVLRQSTDVPTWGCGYVRPTPRMQYTSRSFGEFLVQLLPRPLRPRVRLKRPEGFFPTRSMFQAESPDPVSRSIYEPLFARLANRCAQLRVLQQGQIHVYLAYVILTVVAGLSWAGAWRWVR